MKTKATAYIYILTAIVAVAFLVMYIFTPTGADDLWFLKPVMFARDRGDTFFSGIFDCWCEHFYIDNSRIPQLLLPIILQIPRCITATIIWIVFCTTLILTFKIVPDTQHKFPVFSLMMLLMIVVVPWYNYMFIISYAFNYIWPSALLLLGMLMYIRPARSSVSAFFIGMLTGLWHESFGAALAAGCIGPMIFFPSQRRHDRLAMGIGAAIAFGCYFLVPGTYNRLDSHGTTIISISALRINIIPILYLMMWGLAMCTKRWKLQASTPTATFCAAAICPIIIISLLIHNVRSAYPALLISVPAICFLLPKLLKPRRKTAFLISIAIWIFLLSHLAVATASTIRLNRAAQEIYNAIESSTSKSIELYIDTYDTESSLPTLALRLPAVQIFTHNYFINTIKDYYRLDHLRLLPEALRDYRGNGTPLDGTGNLRLVNGYFVASGNYPDEITATASFACGFEHPLRIMTYTFTGGDDHIYTYLLPIRTFADLWAGDPVKLKLD
ncbi:MAG: DUF6056 family protein [Odoribacter sp.]|nr:DUF6056 family protein [Odoribacter sp.]